MLRRPSGETDHDVPAHSGSSGGLRVLFDVGHPAQVHLFRNTIATLQDRGHETFVTSREKEDTIGLLDAYGIDHRSLSTRGDSLPALIGELLTREVRMYGVARRFQPDVIVSRLGPVPAHVAALVGSRYVAVSDTHIDQALLRRIYQGITFPFVDTICVPDSFQLPIADEKRRHLDFQELAYLHPDHFEPDRRVLDSYGIDPDDPYFVIRLAGWDAYHDVGYTGISPGMLDRLVEMLSEHGTVFISSENELPARFSEYRLRVRPEDIHHVLYYAALYVGDSGTMSSEAAMLGTPSIRTNTMVGDDDENVFRELEERYDLLRSYEDENEAFRAIEQMLDYGLDRIDWRARRERLFTDHPDATSRILDVILESAPTTAPQQQP